jgi:hypothetical protein
VSDTTVRIFPMSFIDASLRQSGSDGRDSFLCVETHARTTARGPKGCDANSSLI